jgi:hypothetical protein
MADTVIVRARRPYVYGAVQYQPGDPFTVPVLEALRLATKGIVSLSRGRPGGRLPEAPKRPPVRMRVRKSA